MSGTVTVKNITLGEGMPKICVPLVGTTLAELRGEAEALKALAPDVVEWRCDYFIEVDNLTAVQEALEVIHGVLPEIPLIFTFRSAKEGGEREISTEYYIRLNEAAAASGLVDIIDVELFNEEADVRRLIAAAHGQAVFVILSNHDFHGTPSGEEIVSAAPGAGAGRGSAEDCRHAAACGRCAYAAGGHAPDEGAVCRPADHYDVDGRRRRDQPAGRRDFRLGPDLRGGAQAFGPGAGGGGGVAPGAGAAAPQPVAAGQRSGSRLIKRSAFSRLWRKHSFLYQ